MYISRGATMPIDDETTLLGELILEENFPDAKKFRPRVVQPDKFMYINDEEVDKRDEWLEDEVIEFSADVDTVKLMDLDSKPFAVPISAVDASSAQIGETNRGIISAIKVAIWKHELEKKPELRRFGPYLAHITPDNTNSLYNYFRHDVFQVGVGKAPQLHKMTDRLRNFFERLAQRLASEIIDNGIVLYDGSLRGGTADTPLKILRDSIYYAHARSNNVVGISKNSILTTSDGDRIFDMLEDVPKPCVKDVHDVVLPKLIRQIMGKVHVVKFAADGFSFRTDVAPTARKDYLDVLGLLEYNATFYSGYPNPLREVYIHANFTPDEILTIQNMVVKKYDMEVVRAFDVRR
jgi:hypothetical protein